MAMSAECGFTHDDTLLNNKPLFHIAQLQIQLMPFVIIGGTNILTRGFDVHETLSLVGEEKITTLHGVLDKMQAAGKLTVTVPSLRGGIVVHSSIF